MSVQLTEEEKKKIAEQEKAKQVANLIQSLNPQQGKSTAPTGNHVNDIIAAKQRSGAGAIAGTTASRAAQGAQFGPKGAIIGAGIGLVEGIMGSKRAKKQAKVAEKRALADIEEKKQTGIGNNINNLINSLRSIL